MARNFYLTTAQRGSLREQAYERASREARLFLSGPDRSYLKLRARLDEVVAQGRRELAPRPISAEEADAWDTSCRIMFLLSWGNTARPVTRGVSYAPNAIRVAEAINCKQRARSLQFPHPPRRALPRLGLLAAGRWSAR